MEKELMAKILRVSNQNLIEIVNLYNKKDEAANKIALKLAFAITMINMISEELDPNCNQLPE